MADPIVCPVNKQNSNDSGLSVAEEVCLKQLPEGAAAIWYEQEPNEYSDFGQEVTTTAREPIANHRNNLKGSPTDFDASGGWNADITKTNTTRLLQGFMFADALELASSVPLRSAQRRVSIVGPSLENNECTVSPVNGSTFEPWSVPQAKTLIVMSGMTNPQANGLFEVLTANASTGDFTLDGIPVSDATPNAQFQTAGFVAEGGSATVVGGRLILTGAIGELVAGAQPGTWVFLGGDEPSTRLGANVGYARIALDATLVVGEGVPFDITTFKPVAATSTEKLHVYVPTILRNGRTAGEIVRRSYTLERTLGRDEDGTQAEYLRGAVPNEFTFNIEGQTKMTADMSFVATDYEVRTGKEGLMAGTRVPSAGEAAYNTSSNVYGMKLYIHDPTTTQPGALFGYLTEGSVQISNGVTPDKAVGVQGAFDVSTSNFNVTGELTAYFTTVKAAAAIRQNADVGLYIINAASNAGFILDLPLLSLGGGRIEVQKDQGITIPVTANGARNAALYTLAYQGFNYLPEIAMPKV